MAITGKEIGKKFEGDVLFVFSEGDRYSFDFALSMAESGFHLISNSDMYAADPKERTTLSYATLGREIVSAAVLRADVQGANEIHLGQPKQAFDYELEFALYSNNLNEAEINNDINIIERINAFLEGQVVLRPVSGEIRYLRYNGITEEPLVTIYNLSAGVMLKGYYIGSEVTNYERRTYGNMRDYITIKFKFHIPKPNACNFALNSVFFNKATRDLEEWYIAPSSVGNSNLPNLPKIGGKFDSDVWIKYDGGVLSLRDSGFHFIDHSDMLADDIRERETNSYIERDGDEYGNRTKKITKAFDYFFEFMMYSDNMEGLYENEKGFLISRAVNMLLVGGYTNSGYFEGLERIKEVELYNFFTGQKIKGYYKSIEQTNDERHKYDNVMDYKSFKITFRVSSPDNLTLRIKQNDLEQLSSSISENNIGVKHLVYS